MNLWMAAGWLMFLCSFLIPAYGGPTAGHGSGLFGGSPVAFPSGDSNTPLRLTVPTIVGLDAMRAAFEGDAYPVASATTNLLIVLSLLGPWSRRFSAGIGVAVGIAAIINLWWLHAAPDGSGALKIGYFTWVLSYLLVSIGLLLRARDPDLGNRTANAETPV